MHVIRLLIDVSGSMAVPQDNGSSLYANAVTAAAAAVGEISTECRLKGIVTRLEFQCFNSTRTAAVVPAITCSEDAVRDAAAIEKAVTKLLTMRLQGLTAMYDSVCDSFAELKDLPDIDGAVLLLITDGDDTASVRSAHDMQTAAAVARDSSVSFLFRGCDDLRDDTLVVLKRTTAPLTAVAPAFGRSSSASVGVAMRSLSRQATGLLIPPNSPTDSGYDTADDGITQHAVKKVTQHAVKKVDITQFQYNPIGTVETAHQPGSRVPLSSTQKNAQPPDIAE